MVIKLIRCEVNPASTEAFSRAQSRWKPLQHLPGFLLQIGGWQFDQKGEVDPQIAWILGFWKEEASYQNFMTHHHDTIAESTKQLGTFQKCSVACYETEDNPLNNTQRMNLSEIDSFRISFLEQQSQFIINSNNRALKLRLNSFSEPTRKTINQINGNTIHTEADWVVGIQSTQ